jgi:ABC-type transport system involved in multi-copper enzyme maturation permease subunit
MRQFVSIAVNAFMELVRQPIYLILMTVSAAFSVFLAAVPYFGFGDDPKLVKDMTLATMLLSGLLTAVLCASASVAQEIRTGTALTVLSKPVSRVSFLLAKFVGLAGTLTLITYTNMVATLLASRMAFDAYGETDTQSLLIYFGLGLLAFAIGGFTNFFLRRTFASDAVWAFVLCTTIALFIVVKFTHLPAGVLILFALFVLAALALACSTRLDTVPTLAVCSGLFLLGLMADYLFKGAADAGSWWAKAAYAITPNWQQFWLADALEDKKSIPWSYVGKATAYVVAYVGAALSVALALFEDRELN